MNEYVKQFKKEAVCSLLVRPATWLSHLHLGHIVSLEQLLDFETFLYDFEIIQGMLSFHKFSSFIGFYFD